MLVIGLIAEVDEEIGSGEGEDVGIDECRGRKAMRRLMTSAVVEAMQHALVAGSEGNKVRRAVPATAKSVSDYNESMRRVERARLRF